jgi:hypothetical protein
VVIAQGIYTGHVRHRRFAPVAHAFRYRLCMLLIDVERVAETLGAGWLHSARGPALLRFRREDFLGDPARPLADCVRERVEQATGRRPAGPVMLLANLRWLGLLMNPIACYYCYAADGETLEAVVAEVTNTPWGERHAYVLPAPPVGAGHARDTVLHARFAKDMHVSPFNPMDMEYRWRSSAPGARIAVHLENHRAGAKVFDATLGLRHEPLTPRALAALLLWRYPLMTLRIAAAIYFEALRLFLRRAPIYTHPRIVQRPEEATG